MSDMNDDERLAVVQARVGRTVCGGRYRIEHVLGIGGMAAVYAGVHRNGRRVAMKLLHPELSCRADIRKRFLREGQAANAVGHPGVVAVIDDDVAEDGAAFLVMERLEGKTLEAVWEEMGHRLPPRMVLAVGRELCSVLAAAHRAAIVHRDIKPENLFLTNDGQLKVLDFGLAQLRDAARPKDTHTGMVFGTPAFMPPEQASGRTSHIDARTDLWAVGATMFTLLSGEMVHVGETAQHFVMLSATEPARSLKAVMPHAHPALVMLVDRALTREKDLRWQSAEEMREAICATSQLLFGDSEVPLMTPAAVGSARERKETSSTTDAPTTRQNVPAFEDAVGDGSAPPTKPDVKIPAIGASSDTPTEKTASDELPTRVGPRPERSEDATHKRAGWSDLRHAIENLDGPGAANSANADDVIHEETQLLGHGIKSLDQTALVAPHLRPDSARHLSSPRAAGAVSTSHQRISSPGPFPATWASARNATATGAVRRRTGSPYLPVVAASILLGLSPIAWFLARDSGSNRELTPAVTSPSNSTASTAMSASRMPVAIVASPEATHPTDPPANSPAPSERVSEKEDAGPRLARTGPSPSLPPNPYASHATARPMPSANPACVPPFTRSADGQKHWKLECL